MDWRGRRERLGSIDLLLDELRQLSGGDTVTVVEGKRDESALRRLGAEGDYLRLSETGCSLPTAAEKVYGEYAEAAMMLDWDGRGALMERRFSDLLQRFGVTVHRDVRRKLGLLVRKDVTDVESLPSLLSRLRGDESGQNVYGF